MAPSEFSAPVFTVLGIALVINLAMKEAPPPTNLNVTETQTNTCESGNPATAAFPKQSGHIYGLPRLHFSGDWRAVTAHLCSFWGTLITIHDLALNLQVATEFEVNGMCQMTPS